MNGAGAGREGARGALPALPLGSGGVVEVLTRFLREETAKFGIRRAVVGVSGGLDSAATLCLGARALGAANVLAVLMPYRTSSRSSIEHGREMVRLLGTPAEEVDITPMVDGYFARYPEADRLRRGNKMARERMSVLYDFSQSWGGLVFGTSNKTELLLGYGTLFGDMASAINPLGDLYKTQVRQIARILAMPEAIVAKHPSADLWEGQTDEAELGYTYEEIDRVLYLMVDLRFDRDALVGAGFPALIVDRIAERVRANQFKRLPPVIAKVSPRTINSDFRYPRDWGR